MPNEMPRGRLRGDAARIVQQAPRYARRLAELEMGDPLPLVPADQMLHVDWNNPANNPWMARPLAPIEGHPVEGKIELPKQGDLPPSSMTPRGEATPPFMLPYETVEELSLRLRGTFITIDGHPSYIERVEDRVHDEIVPKCIGRGFYCWFADGSRRWLTIHGHKIDLRPFEPGFVQWKSEVLYFCRPPARIYRQGTNFENGMVYQHVLRDMATPFPWRGFGQMGLLGLFASRNSEVILPNELEEGKEYRLTNRLAIGTHDGVTKVYWKTVQLGEYHRVAKKFTPKTALTSFHKDELSKFNLI